MVHVIPVSDGSTTAMKAAIENQLKQSPFWQFSLRLYTNAEMRSACLKLQDICGVDVNVLLFLLWAATKKLVLSQGKIRTLDRFVKPWRTQTVVPLRTLRRGLKLPSKAIARRDAEALRLRIKAAELAAENLQQDAMHRFAESQGYGQLAASAFEAARLNLAAYEAMLEPFPKAELKKILQAFDGLNVRNVTRR